jgi:AcrR family transcriptional regulator
MAVPTKTRKPRQTRSKATVEAIVEAGFIALDRHGLSGTTTRHIAEIAGLGVGSLYEYFANKQAVYVAMNGHFTDEIVAMVRGLIPTLVRSDIRTLVKTLLSNFRDLLNRDEGRYLRYAGYAMQNKRHRHPEPVEKLLNELVMQYVMHNPELMRLKNLPAISYILITGGIFTIIRHLAEPHPSIRFEDLSQGLADMAASYLEVELIKLDAMR